jgi:hypothetical protein
MADTIRWHLEQSVPALARQSADGQSHPPDLAPPRNHPGGRFVSGRLASCRLVPSRLVPSRLEAGANDGPQRRLGAVHTPTMPRLPDRWACVRAGRC